MSTVCAISTPLGIGAIAVIRITGEDAFGIFQKLTSIELKKLPYRKIHLTKLHFPETLEFIDEVTFVLYKNPHSFTGEDMVEIFTHGGYVVPQYILRALLKAGASPAPPGEFTKRAFLNNKMDIFKAQSINEITKCSSKTALKMALNKYSNKTSERFKKIQENLIKLIKEFEVRIDFPEEDILPVAYEKIEENFYKTQRELENFIEEGKQGRKILEGPSIAICGKPNVGKSTLFNALLGEERALTSEIAGTTRDYIKEDLFLEGIVVQIFDTAGMRIKPRGEIEKLGIRKSREILKKADIIVWVVDASLKMKRDEMKEIKIVSPESKSLIIVLNKIDKGQKIKKHDIKVNNNVPVLAISAKKRKGLGILKRCIARILYEKPALPSFALTEREENLAIRALDLLEESFRNFKMNLSEELAVLPLKEAVKEMNRIIGIDIEEKVLDEIFKNFCIGK